MIPLEPHPIAGGTVWLAPECHEWTQGLPEGERVASHGRGATAVASVGATRALLREYRRGGALRGVLPDAFPSARRAFAEVRALARLAPLGLAPRPLALEVRGGPLVRLRIATELAHPASDLLARARIVEAAPSPSLATRVGAAVRAMHDAGVSHRDLNVANVLLVGEEGALRVLLVDFDGAAVTEAPVAPARRRSEVLRFCRSLDKWAATARTSALARGAFLRAALPRGERLATLEAARRRHAAMALLGRSPR